MCKLSLGKQHFNNFSPHQAFILVLKMKCTAQWKSFLSLSIHFDGQTGCHCVIIKKLLQVMKRELLSSTCKEVKSWRWSKYFSLSGFLKYSVCACLLLLPPHFVNSSHEVDGEGAHLHANQHVLPWVWLSSWHSLQQYIHLLRIPLHGY